MHIKVVSKILVAILLCSEYAGLAEGLVLANIPSTWRSRSDSAEQSKDGGLFCHGATGSFNERTVTTAPSELRGLGETSQTD
jgi:hypothetical protein